MDANEWKWVSRIAIAVNVVVAILIFLMGDFSHWNVLIVPFVIPLGIASYVLALAPIFWIDKYWKKKYSIRLSMFLIVVVAAGYFYFCVFVMTSPPRHRTREQVMEQQLNRLDRMTRRGDRLLARSQNTIADRTILLEDSVAIINYFNQFLSIPFYNYSDSVVLQYSARYSHFFNRNLIRRPHGKIELIFDIEETNKRRQIIKNNLSIDFFAYSPDKSKLLIVMTYDIGFDPTNANALVLIGSRDDNQIILYRFVGCGFRNDWAVVNKQYALYQVIIDFANRDFQQCGNPLRRSFWRSEHFEKIVVDGVERYRYQLTFRSGWSEERFIRIPEKTEMFIVIDR